MTVTVLRLSRCCARIHAHADWAVTVPVPVLWMNQAKIEIKLLEEMNRSDKEDNFHVVRLFRTFEYASQPEHAVLVPFLRHSCAFLAPRVSVCLHMPGCLLGVVASGGCCACQCLGRCRGASPSPRAPCIIESPVPLLGVRARTGLIGACNPQTPCPILSGVQAPQPPVPGL